MISKFRDDDLQIKNIATAVFIGVQYSSKQVVQLYPENQYYKLDTDCRTVWSWLLSTVVNVYIIEHFNI